ncbi:MAG: sarcosine oxidase subunit gamma family protein [Agriterribacter sp.]
MIAKQSPLDGMATGTATTVTIRELQGLHSFDLRVKPGSVAQLAVTGALGIELPGKTGLMQAVSTPGGEEAHVLCLAPDWWLLVGFEEAGQKLAQLKDQYHFSIVDVSGQRTTIELQGPHARKILAHIWEQDLREKSFPMGSVSQGLIAKAPVIVCHMAPLLYRIMVRSSFAVHVWKVGVDAGVEWV